MIQSNHRVFSIVVLAGSILALLVLAGSAGAVPICWEKASGGNGHYYERVDTSLIDWYTAKSNAELMVHVGLNGHLVTVTSPLEQDFIVNEFLYNTPPVYGQSEQQHYWMGGYQPDGSPEPGGNWQWVTGEPWDFTAWGDGEPNNSGGHEDSLHYFVMEDRDSVQFGLWNDLPYNQTGDVMGYLVEYDPVPEPATFALLASGMLGILARFQHKRRT